MSFAAYSEASELLFLARQNEAALSKAELIAVAKGIGHGIAAIESHANEYSGRSGAFAASQLDLCSMFSSRLYAAHAEVENMIVRKAAA